MKKYPLFFCVLLSLCLNTFSQSYITQTPEKYYFQVKQYGEFVNRFNYKTDIAGNAIDSSFDIPRKDYIHLLFNRLDASFTDSEGYNNKVKAFINDVCNLQDPQYIDKYGNEVSAVVESHVKYKNQEKDIVIVLKPIKTPDNAVKWELADAILPFLLNKSDSIGFIPPNAHESNFIVLKQLLNKKKGLSQYASEGFEPDGLTLLLTELENGNLEILYTNKLCYFINIGHWQIKLEEFTREDKNAGWLISDLKKIK
jgi:hypothetical protein